MTDPAEGRDLRVLLEDAVADVEPRLGLADIEARTGLAPPRRPWFRGALAAGIAVAATAATVAAVTVVTDRSPEQRTDAPPAASTSPDPTPSAGADEPTPAPSEGSTQGPTPAPTTSAGLLPVYYVGDTPAGPRLYREFSTPTDVGSDQTSRLLRALEDAIGGFATDPDYRSGWPSAGQPTGAEVSMVSVERDGAVVIGIGPGDDVPDVTTRPAGMSGSDAALALQQLVYTAQAVLQERVPVRFTDPNGNPLRTLLGVDVSQPVSNDPEMQVLAPVWIIDPAEDGIVGTTFIVKGVGTFFEATASWQLLRGDRVVLKGFTNTREGMTRSEFEFGIKGVDPGEYTLRVYDAAASGEGNGEQQDTKTIVVR